MNNVFNIRDEREFMETLDIVASMALGAIKEWQKADEKRPQTTAIEVREAAKYALVRMNGAEFTKDGSLLDAGVAATLSSLDRVGASIYLDQ